MPKWLDSFDWLMNEREPDKEKWILFRQIGWYGSKTETFYTMEQGMEQPAERGGKITPVYIQIEPTAYLQED